MNRKVVAGFELVLMIISFFAIGYFAGFTEVAFVSAGNNDKDDDKDFGDWLDSLDGPELIGETSWESYTISTTATDIGCCFVSEDGQVCGTASPESCVSDSPFAEGELCADTLFCEKGCCYDDASGIYDENVLEVACSADWVADPNCNLPRANLGCCVLGSDTIFETEGQCEVDSLTRASGSDGIVNWSRDIGEVECLMSPNGQVEGACVFEGGGCSFGVENECDGGNFYADTLCTSTSLNTNCDMTEQTRCVNGKDEVYFVDTCGNLGNVYDSNRTDDPSYWNDVVEYDDLCGAGEGNGGSDDCGNCNRALGGACGAAPSGDVEIGGFYCEDLGCDYEGEHYGNVESWCIYDGAIGDGDDVPGSRHWKASCSQGQVQIEACADYRNQICIQSDGFEVGGEDVEFNNAACVANNWRECISLNEDEEGIEECSETLNCRIETVNIANKFNFDVCLPKYPAGFDLNDERSQGGGAALCGMASNTCTVVLKPKSMFSKSCKIAANKGCLKEEFGQKMNDFCRGLGDCGGSVNIAGEWSDSYKISSDSNKAKYQSPDLGGGYLSRLMDLANPVPGQFAEVEDYSEYLAAAGVLGDIDAPDAWEVEGDILGNVPAGLVGIGMASYVVAAYQIGEMAGVKAFFGGAAHGVAGTAGSIKTGHITVGGKGSAGASWGSYGNYAIGAAIGMIVGGMIADSLGLSEGGSMLMSIGGAMVGASIGNMILIKGATFGLLGWIGVAIIVIALFFGGADCDPIEIQFECKLWQPEVGGSDCEKCNSGPLNPDGTKPCSPYRCESLGATCELLNVGTGNEICVDGNPNDVVPPVINRPNTHPSNDVIYQDTPDGVNIVGANGGCLDANNLLTFGVVTNEPSICRFDVDASKEFGDMDRDLGGNFYLYNHTTSFLLPDPSHGQSQGWNWSGDLDLYVKCMDRNGLISPLPYEVSMCVAEGEDVTPPTIGDRSGGDMLVGFGAVNQDIEIFTNELASCRWDLADIDYSLMGNDMTCEDTLGRPSSPEGYVCNGNVAVGGATSTYYVRCVDQPWLNASEANEGRYSFTIRKPESKISIDNIKPDTDYEVSTDLTTVELRIATSGGGSSHFCSYSLSGYNQMFEILETENSRTHSVDLNMVSGEQKIYVECRDETGDFDRNVTEFEIVKDVSSPAIARVWQDGNGLNLVTIESSECKYSVENCQFAWGDGAIAGSGVEHSINAVRGETYYIRCADEFGNTPNGCSVEVVAT